MRLFLQYLRGKAGKIAAFFLFAVIFVVSFVLYHLPLAAVWYPSALCVILGLAVLLLDFRRVKARHETLRLILCQLRIPSQRRLTARWCRRCVRSSRRSKRA